MSFSKGKRLSEEVTHTPVKETVWTDILIKPKKGDTAIFLHLKKWIPKLPKLEKFTEDAEFQDEIEEYRNRILLNLAKLTPRLRLRSHAIWNILLDLIKQGWRVRIGKTGVQAIRPEICSGTDGRIAKRRQLYAQRNEQLRDSAVKEFVTDMERMRMYKGARVSILSLMRDGRDLVQALNHAVLQSDSDRLRDAVNPYLQFVTETAVCEHTGLRLMDIWRYFRHTWANPYQSVPGRTMMLLVRDAAAPFHPVIGIAALSSAAVKVRARDAYVGWEPEQVQQEIKNTPKNRLIQWLFSSVDEWIKEIYKDDLFEDELLTKRDLVKPTDDVIKQLQNESAITRKIHHRMAESADHKGCRPADMNDDDFWENQARTPLFRSKRCADLAALLAVKQQLDMVKKHNAKAAVAQLMATKIGRDAVISIVRRAKSRSVGTAIADLSVCGALPPYSAILGGKLVAMLAVSPETLAAYKRRYLRAVSVIASSVAGRAVVRPANLVFVGTTSLYGARPSQYERIVIPMNVFGSSDTEANIRYRFLEETGGWGTFQFSQVTSKSVSDFVRSTKNGVRVNYIFGEGASPRMRALREGLSLLGFNQTELLQHGLKKTVYGVSLITNLSNYLLGIDKKPKYIFPKIESGTATRMVSEWWMQRWLIKRLQHQNIESIKAEMLRHTLVYPITHGARVSRPAGES